KQYEKAIAQYEKAIELDPSYAVAYNNLGNTCYSLKQYEKAIAQYEKAIELDPSYAMAHNGIGNFYLTIGNYRAACASYTKCIELQSDFADALIGNARALLCLGQIDKALEHSMKVLQLSPDNLEATLLQMTLSTQKENWIEAGQIMCSVSERTPELLELLQKADSQPNQRLQADQLKQFATSFGLDMETFQTQSDEFKDVLNNQLENASQIFMMQGLQLQALGYCQQGNYQSAISSYSQAIKMDVNNSRLRSGLGDVYVECMQYENAISNYKKAIELDPDASYAYNRLGWLYLLDNHLDEAEKTLEKAIELDDEIDNSYMFNLGTVYAKRGNVEQARQFWQQSLELVDNESDWDRVSRVFYKFVLGYTEQEIIKMEMLINSGVSLVAIKDVLGDAEILATCPQPPDRIEEMITLLRSAIDQQSIQ
ncbi:tpr repeat protein, partial [Leptolyngbya sp. Heron Island J]|uniref:tetratricopeptide repeat protein n=1 Tax=Leptolyngbya sp. Heron Island J TaxID=1385935 RepID=UPI0003B9F775